MSQQRITGPQCSWKVQRFPATGNQTNLRPSQDPSPTFITSPMAQANRDSPLDAASGLETGSSRLGSADRVIDCLVSSISSSSGMTSFIRLWLHTFATSLMSEWRRCKEHAVSCMLGAIPGQPQRSHRSPTTSASACSLHIQMAGVIFSTQGTGLLLALSGSSSVTRILFLRSS